MAQCEKEGLRKLHLDLQIHHQRLKDVVHEAKPMLPNSAPAAAAAAALACNVNACA